MPVKASTLPSEAHLEAVLDEGDLAAFVAVVHAAADAQPVEGTACREGCTPCCHLRVSATAPEVLVLAARVRALGDSQCAAVHAAHTLTAGLDEEARAVVRRPCPLLNGDGRCAVYDIRPLACRLHFATDSDGCAALAVGRPGNPAPPSAPLATRARLTGLQLTALQRCGFAPLTYELNEALDRVLAIPDAARRWLAGEAVFDGVTPGASPDV